MRDGLTEKLKAIPPASGIDAFLERYEAKMVALTGPSAGMEWALDAPRKTIGRGPGVDLAFNVAAMSRQHCAIEFTDRGFRIRDLGSTNGLMVNGNRVQVCDLDHGDRFELAGYVFQLVIEERDDTPTYDLSSEG